MRTKINAGNVDCMKSVFRGLVKSKTASGMGMYLMILLLFGPIMLISQSQVPMHSEWCQWKVVGMSGWAAVVPQMTMLAKNWHVQHTNQMMTPEQ